MFLALLITRWPREWHSLILFIQFWFFPCSGNHIMSDGIDTTNQINYPECSELVYTYYTAQWYSISGCFRQEMSTGKKKPKFLRSLTCDLLPSYTETKAGLERCHNLALYQSFMSRCIPPGRPLNQSWPLHSLNTGISLRRPPQGPPSRQRWWRGRGTITPVAPSSGSGIDSWDSVVEHFNQKVRKCSGN